MWCFCCRQSKNRLRFANVNASDGSPHCTGCALWAAPGWPQKGAKIANRRSGQSLHHATQRCRPRWVHTCSTILCRRTTHLCPRSANFNASDANLLEGKDSVSSWRCQMHPPGRARVATRAPNRKPTSRTIPPCHEVPPPEVGAYLEHKSLSPNHAVVSELCKIQR